MSYVVELILKGIQNTDPSKEHIVIDGFPRNEEGLRGYISRREEFPDLKKFYHIDVPLEQLYEWVKSREEEFNREEDNMKVFEKRVEVYLGHTRPIIDHFSSIRKKQSIIQTDELGNWIDAKKYDDIVRKVVKDILRHEPSHISKDKTKVSAFN